MTVAGLPAVRRHIVADNGAIASALGENGLRRIVAGIDVHIGQVSQEDV